jgi:magnesium transporter
MISYYYKDASGQLSTEAEFRRGAWIYVEAPSEAEVSELVENFNLEAGHLADALDEDEQPRLEREGKQTYLFVRFAYKKSSGTDTAPLLIILGSDFIMTISLVALPALAWLQRGRAAFTTADRTTLVLLVLQHIGEQYDVYISQTSRRIKSIRSRLRDEGITNQDLIAFATIEDELNEFLSSLQPTNATLRRLLTGRNISFKDDDQDLVEDVLLNNDQSIEASRANLKSISNIRDAYSAISANNLNSTLTVLTIATLVISLPSFAMGIYSMNITLPAQHTRWIFWVIMSINVVLMATVVYIARKKRIL